MKYKAAFIATGDEITQGDILNSTGPAIAQHLAERNIHVTEHRLLPDDQAAITQAIQQLLLENDYLFLTGGLGPTSDDLTRFALADALDQPLIFDEASWQAIVTRLSAYKLHIAEDNKRQAYFPTAATILPNLNGTAAGCRIEHQGKTIFMLPGPPSECLPMFETSVLSLLPDTHQHKLHWLLLGASEGEIAHNIDKAVSNISCRTGYRAAYPYLEIKAWADDNDTLQHISDIVEPLVTDYLVSKTNTPASVCLQQLVQTHCLSICDNATGGLLKSTLLEPKTQLTFVDADNADILVSGLEAFWQATPSKHTTIRLQYHDEVIERDIILRGKQVRVFAVEWACWQIQRLVK